VVITPAYAIYEVHSVHHQRVFIVGIDDAAFDRDCPGGQQIIARHHSHPYAGLLALGDCPGNLFSENILYAQQREHGQVVGLHFEHPLIVFFLEA